MASVANRHKLSGLQEWFRPYIEAGLAAIQEAGISGTIYDVYRSGDDQNRRFARGDTKAKAGQSAHQYGLAIDFVVSKGEQSDLQRLVQSAWRQWGFGVISWDPAHVEHPAWRQVVRASGIRIP